MNDKCRLLLLFVVIAASSWADSPLPPPEFFTIISSDKSTRVDCDPVSNSITAYKMNSGRSGPIVWKINDWSRWIDISFDGQICLLDLSGGLLTTSFRMNDPVVRIYELGKLAKTLSIRELLSDPLNLERTVSHYSWNKQVNLEKEPFTIWTIDSKIQVSRNPLRIQKFRLTEEEKKIHGARMSSEANRFANWFTFIGK